MIIADRMLPKVARALKCGNNVYQVEDIDRELVSGNMQSHCVRDTWAVTQVHQWPQRKAVNVLLVVGDMSDMSELERKITHWAKFIGADLITAIGRDGWWEHRTPGWRKTGVLYSKDI